jgi:hypothetical protein
MALPPDKDARARPAAAAAVPAKVAPKAPAPAPRDSHVTHDARGNAQWDLGLSTTAVRKLSRTGMLRKLDNSELSLVDDPPQAEKQPQKPTRVEGFNPYDRPLPSKKPRR